jgi:hypothetical protein
MLVLSQWKQSVCMVQKDEDHLVDHQYLTYGEMISKLNLTHTELVTILRSMTHADLHILEYVHHYRYEDSSISSYAETTLILPDNFSPSNQFRLSSRWISGKDESNPILLPSTGLDNNSDAQIIGAGVQTLYDWRNEQIDAFIVRLLKKAFVEKTGEFPGRHRLMNVALS